METLPESAPKVRALVVDDEPDILRFLERCLARKGYAVRLCRNPREAAQICSQDAVDLVITDLKMPEMDGVNLLREIKEFSPLTEVILVTGYPTVESAVGSMKLGAFDYLVKPFNVSEILEIAERAMRHLQAARQVSRFREMDQIKEEFLAHVSHELRTPLASIKTASQLLRDELGEKWEQSDLQTAGKFVSIIQRGAGKMVRLVDDLLDAFRFGTGKLVLHRVPLSLERMIGECLEEFMVPCQERGLVLESAVEAGMPAVQADPIKLRQVLHNLLGNAMKFTTAGGKIALSARRAPPPEGAAAGEWVELSVRDTGIGIASEKQQKIFEKFYQEAGPNGRSASGLGLGLSLVKSIVEAHGGTVSVHSRPGEGSTFSVRMPVSPPANKAGNGSPAGRAADLAVCRASGKAE